MNIHKPSPVILHLGNLRAGTATLLYITFAKNWFWCYRSMHCVATLIIMIHQCIFISLLSIFKKILFFFCGVMRILKGGKKHNRPLYEILTIKKIQFRRSWYFPAAVYFPRWKCGIKKHELEIIHKVCSFLWFLWGPEKNPTEQTGCKHRASIQIYFLYFPSLMWFSAQDCFLTSLK